MKTSGDEFQLITIYDIAKKTGYSPTTVSKVFNNYSDVSLKTRKKILDAASELGYLPNTQARMLSTKRSWTIGILFVETTGAGLRHPFFGGLIEGFKKTAVLKGYDLMFISKDIGGKPNTYLEHCKMRGVDGIMVFLPDSGDPDYKELIHGGIPCIIFDSESTEAGTISSDNVDGSLQAMRYLYSLGHRDIAHIAGGLNTAAGLNRKEGYELALQQLQLEHKEGYICISSDEYTVDKGYKAMMELLSLRDQPTAVYAAGDNLAIGAMLAVRDSGLNVPGDISIIGFDDIETVRFLTPALTTVRQDTEQLGRKAAEMLITSIESGGELPQNWVEPVQLVIRDSCRAIR